MSFIACYVFVVVTWRFPCRFMISGDSLALSFSLGQSISPFIPSFHFCTIPYTRARSLYSDSIMTYDLIPRRPRLSPRLKISFLTRKEQVFTWKQKRLSIFLKTLRREKANDIRERNTSFCINNSMPSFICRTIPDMVFPLSLSSRTLLLACLGILE